MEKKKEVIWITGASSGIGKALAVACAAHYSKKHRPVALALSARSEEVLEALCTELSEKPGIEAHSFPLDVLSYGRNQEVAAAIEECFQQPVSIFVPCAGTYTQSNSLEKFDSKEHERIMQLNYCALLYGIEAVLPSMKREKRGQILGVSSLVGYFGLPKAVGYSASKAAVINALQSLRFELKGSGIEVKVVNPGFVKTPLTDKNDFPMPTIITAEQAAEEILSAFERPAFEVHFPKSLSIPFKFFRMLPHSLFEWVIEKFVYRQR
ncbi:SDR family NAD(P)-dependent oxidoreductase [bacterium]|nr:SDR family NAD(P)-dependent oxidoreductase [bacterium]